MFSHPKSCNRSGLLPFEMNPADRVYLVIVGVALQAIAVEAKKGGGKGKKSEVDGGTIGGIAGGVIAGTYPA